MRRREFMTLLGGAAAAWPLTARTQQGERLRRVGMLLGAQETDPETKRRIDALVRRLRELGWTKGRNIRFDYLFSTEVERMRGHAAEIVELRPDVIVVNSNPLLAALRQVDRTIPTVFAQVADPVGSGFVESLARPGGNLTGFTNFEAEIGGKWLGLIKEIAPRVRRTLVLLHRETAANAAFLRAARLLHLYCRSTLLRSVCTVRRRSSKPLRHSRKSLMGA
jgi:putative tryptophan/tyrosine transport system substrate-binding protein